MNNALSDCQNGQRFGPGLRQQRASSDCATIDRALGDLRLFLSQDPGDPVKTLGR
jgi:hypothetical protein